MPVTLLAGTCRAFCAGCGTDTSLVAELRQRIEELTAESIEAHRLLELERAKDGDVWKERALTERAAREQAEAEMHRSHAQVNRLLSERDEHKAAREQAEKDLAVTERWRKDWVRVATEYRGEADAWQSSRTEQTARRAAETALAAANERVKELEMMLSLKASSVAEAALASAEARVKELEGTVLCNQRAADREYKRRVAAETALASARSEMHATKSTVRGLSGVPHMSLLADSWIRLWGLLTSHPAPVAAPHPSCIYAVCKQGGPCMYPKPDGTACSLIEAPVAAPCANGNCADCNLTPCQCKVRAAPCAGCARLSAAIDQAIRDMLSGGRPFEAGVTKAINDLRAAQKEPR